MFDYSLAIDLLIHQALGFGPFVMQLGQLQFPQNEAIDPLLEVVQAIHCKMYQIESVRNARIRISNLIYEITY